MHTLITMKMNSRKITCHVCLILHYVIDYNRIITQWFSVIFCRSLSFQASLNKMIPSNLKSKLLINIRCAEQFAYEKNVLIIFYSIRQTMKNCLRWKMPFSVMTVKVRFVRKYWCFGHNFKQKNIFLPWNWKFDFWQFSRLP